MSAAPLPSEPYLYFGNMDPKSQQHQIPNFVGLALKPNHAREIEHNALKPLPFVDGAIRKIQSEDVFEHLPKDAVPSVLNEIYRVLAPAGVFRLSMPDYRSPLLKRRSYYDQHGRVMGDAMMGGTSLYDPKTTTVTSKFWSDGNAHLWFPTYEQVLEVIIQSNLRLCSKIEFYQYFIDDERFICNPYPLNDMYVCRSPPQDMRAGGKPISIIVDFIR